jgi:hypothetical protein
MISHVVYYVEPSHRIRKACLKKRAESTSALLTLYSELLGL